MFNCCLGKSGSAASNNNLLQDAPNVPNRNASNASPRNEPAPSVPASAIGDIFSAASLPEPPARSLSSNPNATLAQNAIDYVATISTVTAYRPADLYENTDRDAEGKLVDTTLSENGRVSKGRLEAYRKLADERHDTQIAEQAGKGNPLSQAQSEAQLAKHVLAAIHETAAKYTADQMPTNCYEKALLSFETVAKIPDNPQLDVIGLKPSLPRTATDTSTGGKVFLPRGPDHTVLLLGRDPESDVTDPKTWNANAVICDASNDECYFADDLISRFGKTVIGSADGPLIFENVISLPENSDYDPDPSVLHETGAGQGAAANPEWVAFGQTDAEVDDQSDAEAIFF